MVELLRLPDDADRGYLLQFLLAREDMASTGIGDGIAMPHARNPIVLHVPQPMVTLCFLETPIDFLALYGQPVNCLFTIVAPTVRSHLFLLSRLFFVLRNKEFKNRLEEQRPREEILQKVVDIETALAAACRVKRVVAAAGPGGHSHKRLRGAARGRQTQTRQLYRGRRTVLGARWASSPL